jgi:CRISPR/Cas system CMR-associated protein Cmr5 small subunit
MSTIGYILNRLVNYEYNIHIIISWFFENKGIQNFDMNNINNRILDIVSKCDVFIYHSHINDYHVNATKLPSIVSNNCLKLIVANYRLDYTNSNVNEFNESLKILNMHISSSSFSDFNFITENYKNIMFFNTTNHPTHYLLFLQSEYISNKILKNGQTITIGNYFDEKNRTYFKDFSYVTLPGKEIVNDQISMVTGIKKNADYFDFV